LRRVTPALAALTAVIALLVATGPAWAAPDRPLTVSRTTIKKGQQFRIAGTGCARRATIRIRLNGKLIASRTAERNGSFNRKVRVSRRTAPGEYSLRVTCGNGVMFVVVVIVVQDAYGSSAPLVTVDRTSVPAGRIVTVSRTDCVRGTPSASLDGTPVAMTVAKTDRKGFSARAVIPRGIAPGKYQLKTTCNGRSAAASTTINVLDAADTVEAGAVQPLENGSKRSSAIAVAAGLLVGIPLLFVSLQLGRRRRLG
jgi:hypothetical protein